MNITTIRYSIKFVEITIVSNEHTTTFVQQNTMFIIDDNSETYLDTSLLKVTNYKPMYADVFNTKRSDKHVFLTSTFTQYPFYY